MSRRSLILWVPLGLFVAFLVMVAWGLYFPSERTIRSKMVGQKVPEFALPAMLPGRPGVATGDYGRGEPRIINVFASWCVPCIAEAPVLMELKQRGVPIFGIAVRDRPEDIARFLGRHGDPFEAMVADETSELQLGFGSAGVPETFLIDGRGIVRMEHIGPIGPTDIPEIVRAVEAAR